MAMKTAANYLPHTNAVQACARRMRQKAWKNKTADTRAHGVSIAAGTLLFLVLNHFSL